MCLAVPYTVETITGDRLCVARAGSVRTEIRTDLVGALDVGDVVLVHAGFAIERLEERDSEELLRLFDEIRAKA
jgi:hydrogenase expression/formation protein HypC